MEPSAYFRDRRQGDILSIESGDGVAADYAVVSQSCDVVLSKRENVLLAPLVEIDDAATRRGALNRENPRYVVLPLDSGKRFADLNCITAYAKADVVGAPATAGIDPTNDQVVRDFGLAVGRWFGRFAFPDEVQPWLAPLQTQIREKYDSPNSAIGQVLHRVSEIRVEADSWSSQPCALIVHVIVGAGWMPAISNADFGSGADAVITNSARASALIATELLASANDARTIALWDELSWALASSCTPKGKFAEDSTVMAAVTSVEAMLWTDEDFPLVRYRKSEQLDVDFLSEPMPL